MAAAAALCAAGSLVFAVSDSVLAANVGRLLIGAGSAFSFPGALALAVLWFRPERFASLTGVAQAAAMGGAVLGTAPTGAAVAAIGWRDTMLLLAAAAALFAVLLWLTARDRPRSGGAAAGLMHGLRTVTANPQTWLSAAFGFWITGPMLAFAGLWGVPYVSAVYGLDRTGAAATVALLFVGWGISAPLVGGLSDRLGRRRPLMLAGSALTTLSLAAILYVPDLSLAALSALFLANGFTGAVMLLGFACGKEHNPPAASGAAIGIVNTAVMLSGAVFQPLLGWLLDLNWTGAMADGARLYTAEAYRAAMAPMPFACALAMLAAYLLREPPRPMAARAGGASAAAEERRP
jgi:MFS family permease